MRFLSNTVLAACLAGLATASPRPKMHTTPIRGEPKASFVKGRSAEAAAAPAAPPKQLTPYPEPAVDRNNLANLEATYDAFLHYVESADDVDQQIANIESQDPEFPMVQLEFSNYIQSMSCSDTSASVTFTTQEAFDRAAANWQTHEQFVIISMDPACGPNHDDSQRDYMLASVSRANPETLTVDTNVEFIEWKQAFGETAHFHGTIGTYASTTGQKKKRQIDGSTDFDWDIFPTTPLGAAFAGETGFGLFGNLNLEVACIDCGTRGQVTVTGTFDFSLFEGVETASVTIEGSVSASINLGLVGREVLTIPIANARLATIPLSPLTIAGIVTVGPLITVDAGANIDLTAQGTLIMGATLDWPNLRVVGDFAGETGESSGLDPDITPRADLRTTLSATLRIDAPINIGVGLDIANGLFDRSLTLGAAPGFRINAVVDNDPACEGVSVNANLGVPVSLDVFEVTTVPLVTDFTTVLFETCFPVDIPPELIPPTNLLPSATADEGSAPADAAPTPRNEAAAAPDTTPAPAPSRSANGDRESPVTRERPAPPASPSEEPLPPTTMMRSMMRF